MAIALAGTRVEAEEVLLGLDSRDSRSRTICGISTRCTCVIVRPLRCVLSLVRCGDGGRCMSRTLSFFELAGLGGGEGKEDCAEAFWRRGGGRTTLLYASLLRCSPLGLRVKRWKREILLCAGRGVSIASILTTESIAEIVMSYQCYTTVGCGV